MGLRTLLLDEMERRGLDRTRFAEYLGVDRSTVSRWLSGSVVPGSEHLAQIAERLKRPLVEVMEAARADSRARRGDRESKETLAEEVAQLRAVLADREAELEELRARKPRRRRGP